MTFKDKILHYIVGYNMFELWNGNKILNLIKKFIDWIWYIIKLFSLIKCCNTMKGICIVARS